MTKNSTLLKMINSVAASVKNCRADHVTFKFQSGGDGFWSCDVGPCYVSHGRGRRVIRREFFGLGDTPAAARTEALRIARAAHDNGEEGF